MQIECAPAHWGTINIVISSEGQVSKNSQRHVETQADQLKSMEFKKTSVSVACSKSALAL